MDTSLYARTERYILFAGWMFETFRTGEQIAAMLDYVKTGTASDELHEKDKERISNIYGFKKKEA